MNKERKVSLSFNSGYVSYKLLRAAIDEFETERYEGNDQAILSVTHRESSDNIYTTFTFVSRQAK